MSDAPERIWVDGNQDWDSGSWSLDKEFAADVEYIRADRIEALTAENKMLRDAVYIDDLTVTMQAIDRSKAIEGIGRALDLLNADMVVEAKTGLRATLAEIKGESHE